MTYLLVEWWNWQTRMIKGHVPQGVRVQVPPRPPIKAYCFQYSVIESIKKIKYGRKAVNTAGNPQFKPKATVRLLVIKKVINKRKAWIGPSIVLFRMPRLRNGMLIPTKIIDSKGVAKKE